VGLSISTLHKITQVMTDPEVLAMAKNWEALAFLWGVDELRPFMEAVAKTQPKRPVPVAATNDAPAEKKWGSLDRAVKETISKSDSTFTCVAVVKAMLDDGYVFSANHPEMAVNAVLRRMLGRREITVVEPGKGRKPTVYARAKGQEGKAMHAPF